MIVAAFGAAIALGTALLLVPFSTAEGQGTDPLEALFTATSAVSVTGLVVADTAEHWSRFGQTVILILIQLGGFGIMTLSSLVALFCPVASVCAIGRWPRPRPTPSTPARSDGSWPGSPW